MPNFSNSIPNLSPFGESELRNDRAEKTEFAIVNSPFALNCAFYRIDFNIFALVRICSLTRRVRQCYDVCGMLKKRIDSIENNDIDVIYCCMIVQNFE